jgi:hypothetical protein
VTRLGECSLISVIFYIGQLLENHKSSPNFLATFFGHDNALIWTNTDWAKFLGVFFTTSSGHPGRSVSKCEPVEEITFLKLFIDLAIAQVFPNPGTGG